MNLKHRILFIPVAILTLMLGLIVTINYLNNAMFANLIYPKFEESILEASKKTLKSTVEAEVSDLQDKLKGITSPEEQKAIVEKETDPIRFFDDNSGYIFSYDMEGTRISVPPDKSKNGVNFIGLQDLKGNYLVKDLVNAAKNGGDFC